MTLTEILKQYFGYSSFKEGQEETITSVLNDQDTLSILPTGTGKSLCYQLPSYVWNHGLIVVVSPLISLMYDQVQQIQLRGEKRVVALNSQLNPMERNYVFQHLTDYCYLFISPEMLAQEEVLQRLQSIEIALFVVDEAHCISQWGIDFRPEYRELGHIRERLNQPLTLALTATATTVVEEDIKQVLFPHRSPQVIRLSVNRPNIFYQVVHTHDKEAFIQAFVNQYAGPGIIYFSSKKQAEKIAELLRTDCHVAAAAYHGGMSAVDRAKIQQQFLRDELEVLCATTAFGMGVNKANIRYVMHYHMSASLEAFVQESGRAGRDGKKALSILLYQDGDEHLPRLLSADAQDDFSTFAEVAQKDPTLLTERKNLLTDLQQKWAQRLAKHPQYLQKLTQEMQIHRFEQEKQLASMLDYIHTTNCRRQVILHYFGEACEHGDNCCDFGEIHYEDILPPRLPKQEVKKEKDFSEKIKQLFNLGNLS